MKDDSKLRAQEDSEKEPLLDREPSSFEEEFWEGFWKTYWFIAAVLTGLLIIAGMVLGGCLLCFGEL